MNRRGTLLRVMIVSLIRLHFSLLILTFDADEAASSTDPSFLWSVMVVGER
jgi:hypothetical protein